MTKLKHYLWLASISLFISTFTFGGGYVVVPMIRKYYVEKKRLFSNDELMEMAAVAQSSPGAIAINLSVLAGKKVAGLSGVFINAICSIIPPLVILGLISNWYAAFAANVTVMAVLKGMQACVTALIIDIIIDMYQLIRQESSRLLRLLVPISFVANAIFNLNVIYILFFSVGLCLLDTYFQQTREAS
ncbi:chromate transporter [Enterococcus avium]|uniref:Chromate transporter n=1 Tax=Enterococcus avium TaxID=33945 RepID=A0ABD5F831_ENTAV|nr:chromate transporter [Enterococcus avium]MBU5368318.1 chromate transporter [Enterococcus avium]MDO7797480.1 chromate transporter [Enterococcus avium]MDT2397876.1 chromate transporter [Enterococcus avium]MDT2422642.1 chromate transporter [Enterococcus avium]MDT2435531.1 chromate transporter [Enterococcus avium]